MTRANVDDDESHLFLQPKDEGEEEKKLKGKIIGLKTEGPKNSAQPFDYGSQEGVNIMRRRVKTEKEEVETEPQKSIKTEGRESLDTV